MTDAIDSSSDPPRWVSWLWLVLLLPVVLYTLRISQFGAWLVDDALISFGFARTLETAGVLAQSPEHAPVEAISNPSWTLLLAGLRWVGLFDQGQVWWGYADYVWVIRGLAVLFFAGTLGCLYAAVRSITSAASAAVGVLAAGTILALLPPYVMWTVSGLENPLYGFIVAALLMVVVIGVGHDTVLHPGTAVAAALLVVLAATTRPDGLVFAPFYPVVALTLFRRRWLALLRAAVVYTTALVIPVAGLLVARHAVYGLWVPNTAVAKRQGTAELSEILARANELPAMLTWPSLVAVAALVATALISCRSWPAGRQGLLVSLAALGLALLGFGVLKEDWMAEFRFGTPTVVLAIGCLALASAVVLDASPRWRWAALAQGLVALVLAAAILGTASVGGARIEKRTKGLPISGCFVADRYGRLFNLYADRLGVPPEGTLLAPDIGGTLMTSRLQVVDLAGLADATIARLRAAGDKRGIRDYVLEQVEPTFVHIHGSWLGGFPKDKRFRRDYVGLGSAGDYVRRDAIPPGVDLRALAIEGRDLSTAANSRPRTSDCGALEPGQLPT